MSNEIIIRIIAPDGVDVRVDTGGGAERPFVERPAPPQPAGYCPIHDTDWKLVPGGVSKKTGKRYNPFWACPERGCNEKPQRTSAVEDVSQEPMPF